MTKQNKYNYFLVIQQNYGNGWEDNSEYEATSNGKCIEQTEVTIISKNRGLPITKKVSLCSHDLKEYNLTSYNTRLIFRKELNKEVLTTI